MDFNFSKDEKLLQGSLREFLRDKIIPIAAEEDRKAPLSRGEALKYLKSLIPFGYIGPRVPASSGGPGLTFVETGIIFHELGKAWASLGAMAMATANMISIVLDSGENEAGQAYLSSLLNVDAIGGIAFTESGAGTDLSLMTTTATPKGDHYIVNGTKSWVSNGAVLDIAIVAVKLENTDQSTQPYGIILVEKDISPFRVAETPKMGLKGLSTASLEFMDCRVPKENLLRYRGKLHNPFKFKGLPETYLIPVIATGIAEAALEAAVTYAKQRMQFGKVLGRFQMIQKMIAEMATGLDAAKLLCFRALKMMDEGQNRKREIAMAASCAKQTATDAASTAIQIYGAYGYSDEFPMERYYRDAVSLSLMEGAISFHQLDIAEDIMGISAIK